MRRVFVLLLVLLLTLSGCKTSSKNGGYQLYFRVDPETSTHGAAIAGQARTTPAERNPVWKSSSPLSWPVPLKMDWSLPSRRA